MINISIQSFLDSSRILYNSNKYIEALCLACIAVDACALKCYPNIKKSSERYKVFLKENFSDICELGFPGIIASNIKIKVNVSNSNLKLDENGYVNMEQIIYHVLRCGLVHQCEIDKTVEFTNITKIGDWNDKFYIPKAIILGLISVVEKNQDGDKKRR